MSVIFPSILAADFGHLESEISHINGSKAGAIHVDVMDGNFVPNLSIGFPVIKAIKEHARKPLDFHLMVAAPDTYFERLKDAGAWAVTVHLEACTHLNRTVEYLHSLGMRAGVAINPHTPVALLEDILPDIDSVLVMSVNPGFGAQRFIEGTYKKIEQLVLLKRSTGATSMIHVDGGVDHSNAARLTQHGCDALIAGTSLFSQNDIVASVLELENIANQLTL